jgi:sortase (surface protein transpeptidase)
MNPPFFTSEHKRTIGAFGVIFLVLGAGMILASHSGVDSYSPGGTVTFKSNAPLFPPGELMSPSVPRRLRIPDLYIDTNFVPLDLQSNGEIEVPKGYEEVGWYTKGPTPGELGPSVVLGHVDSYKGPGVFLTLGKLTAGDYIYIDREDGTTATFRVTSLERYDRDAFPSEKVYGDIDHAGLRLITCSGTYDKQTQEYDRVLVVYAMLVTEGSAQ